MDIKMSFFFTHEDILTYLNVDYTTYINNLFCLRNNVLNLNFYVYIY